MNDESRGAKIGVAVAVTVLFAASLAFAGGLWWQSQGSGRREALEERLERLEKRDVQVREFLARSILPPKMHALVAGDKATQEALRERMTVRLNVDTLEWEGVDPAWNFGVDRRWLKPAGPTGATGQLGEHRPEK